MKKLGTIFNLIIVLGLVALAAVLLWPREKKKVTHSPEEVDRIVNKYLKQSTATQIKREVELREQMEKILKSKPPPKSRKPIVEDMSSAVPQDQQIWKDQSQSELSPEEEIKNRVRQREEQKKQEAQDRAEYARQFIENARREGYEIKLSEDLKVISVKPIENNN